MNHTIQPSLLVLNKPPAPSAGNSGIRTILEIVGVLNRDLVCSCSQRVFPASPITWAPGFFCPRLAAGLGINNHGGVQ